MKQAQFQNQFTYTGPKGQVFRKPSMTVPDQIMSIQEIMDRYARGMPLAGSRQTVYDEDYEEGDEIMPDLERMDKIDRIEVYRQKEAEYKQLREELPRKYPKKTAPPGSGAGGVDKDEKPDKDRVITRDLKPDADKLLEKSQ